MLPLPRIPHQTWRPWPGPHLLPNSLMQDLTSPLDCSTTGVSGLHPHLVSMLNLLFINTDTQRAHAMDIMPTDPTAVTSLHHSRSESTSMALQARKRNTRPTPPPQLWRPVALFWRLCPRLFIGLLHIQQPQHTQIQIHSQPPLFAKMHRTPWLGEMSFLHHPIGATHQPARAILTPILHTDCNQRNY